MAQSRAGAGRHVVALTFVISAVAFAVGVASPATADVTEVEGLAYNYYTDVGFFGGPSRTQGYGQVVCTSTNPDLPEGCVHAFQAEDSASPSVTCPEGGGSTSVTDPNGARSLYGPAVIFGGIWPEESPSAPPSGPLTSSIDCRLGEGGYVTASTSAILMPPGSMWTPRGSTNSYPHPGGVGPGPFIADEVHSTCTANEEGVTASTRIVNGILETQYDSQSGEPIQTEAVPTNPPVNYTREGTIDHVGDNYRIVFNEQIINPDGSITVNAAHMYLLGPTAVGEMVIGSSTCGPLTTITTPSTTTTTMAPTTTTTMAPTTTTTMAPTTTTTMAPGGMPVTKDECKRGGWENFGFRNQGQCVSFVASQGRSGGPA